MLDGAALAGVWGWWSEGELAVPGDLACRGWGQWMADLYHDGRVPWGGITQGCLGGGGHQVHVRVSQSPQGQADPSFRKGEDHTGPHKTIPLPSVLWWEAEGGGMVSMDSCSTPPKVTSMGCSSPADLPTVAVSHCSNSRKEKWWAFRSPFSPLWNITCSPCCSSFLVWSWCRWPHALTLYTCHQPWWPRCPASDKGAPGELYCSCRWIHKANSGPLSMRSASLWATSTSVVKWPWWGWACISARPKICLPPMLVLGTIIRKAMSCHGFLTSPQAPAWERLASWVWVRMGTTNCLILGQKSSDPHMVSIVQGPINWHYHTWVRTHSLLLSETGDKGTLSLKGLVHKYLGGDASCRALMSLLGLIGSLQSAQMQVEETVGWFS